MVEIIKYIIENFPQIASYVIATVCAATISILVYKYIFLTHKKVHNLPCASHNNNLLEINTNHRILIEKIDDIRQLNIDKFTVMEELSAWVMKKDQAMIDVLKKRSPLSMTPVGKTIFERMPTKKLVDDYREYLLREVEQEDPKTAFDVEDISFKIMLRHINHPMFNELKEYLYYSPEKVNIEDPETGNGVEVEVNMSMAMRLMGVYLRDLYLEQPANRSLRESPQKKTLL